MNLKLLAAGMMAASLIGCADTIEVPDDSGDNNVSLTGQIVYNHVIDWQQELAETRITDSSGNNSRKILDGFVGGAGANRILYLKFTDQNQWSGDLYVADRDGGNSRKVISINGPGQRVGPATISANGTHVAFMTRDSVNPTTDKRLLRVVRTDGTDLHTITEDLAYETLFSLSPDGSKVAYFDDGEGSGSQSNATLRVARTDGSGSQILRNDVDPMHDLASSIEWSPDGNRIAFASEGATHYRVQVINADGTGYIDVGTGLFPTWSPDGSKLAWTGVSQSGDNPDIVMTSDMGITVEYLSQAAEGESHPQFSPDGKKILCMMWIGETQESAGKLKVIDIETKASKVIAESASHGYWVR